FGVTTHNLFGVYLNRFAFIDGDEEIIEILVVVRLEISAETIRRQKCRIVREMACTDGIFPDPVMEGLEGCMVVRLPHRLRHTRARTPRKVTLIAGLGPGFQQLPS